MIKQALTWMICITYSFCSYSQIFKGKVIDGNNSRPIDIVSVSITDADNMTLVYTATDAKGGFELEYKDNPESKYLFISCLGYQSQKILLTSYKNNTEITLSKTDVKLK